MSNTASKRKRIWEEEYGNARTAFDIFGNHMTIENFVLDHIFPISRGGSNDDANLIPLSKQSNEEKADQTKGFVNGRRFAITLAGIGSDGGRIGIFNIL